MTFVLREYSVRIANRVGEDSRCREVLYTFGVVVPVCFSNGPIVPRRLAVSCKYFKQSKWPFSAAPHADCQIDHICAQQDIRVCEDHLEPDRQYKKTQAL